MKYSLLSKKGICTAFSAGLILVSTGASAENINLKVTVSPDSRHQSIEYFGAADAWSGNFVGAYWTKARADVARWLFSTADDASGNPQGIGLSAWRVNLGAGTLEQDGADIMPYQRRAESFLSKDGHSYDWSKCAGQQYFMKEAKTLGCNKFILFSNSPCVQWTLNGKGYSVNDRTANIKPEGYAEYSKYLADVAAHFKKQGFNITHISPINEPTVNWDSNRQEGSPWKGSELKKMAVALDGALSANKKLKGVKILMGECANYKFGYADAPELEKRFDGDVADNQIYKLFCPSSPDYVGGLKHISPEIAIHAYHCSRTNAEILSTRAKGAEAAAKYGVRIHQSEWCLLPNYLPPVLDGFTIDWNCPNRGDIQVGLLIGRMIYGDLVYGNEVAWTYWKGMEIAGNHALVKLIPGDGKPVKIPGVVSTNPDGSVPEILRPGTAEPNKILWSIGNYSRFIRPGYTRIDVSGAEDMNGTVASGYISPDKKEIVVVFVNSSFNNTGASVELPEKYSAKVKSVDTYVTDETSDLQRHSSTLSEVAIPPRSLVTLRIKL